MSLSKHVNTIVKSAFYNLRNIAHIRNYLSKEAAKTLVIALVISKIYNCNSLLIGLPMNLLAKLQSVQNAAARVIERVGKQDRITPVLSRLHWLPVHQRIIFKINVLTFKCLHNQAPAYLMELHLLLFISVKCTFICAKRCVNNFTVLSLTPQVTSLARNDFQ